MDQGKNVSPQWAPDGRSIAFVSDRSGVSDIFLYDLGDARDLPAHRFLHRRPGHHAALAGAVAGPARPTGWPSCTTRTRSIDVYTITNPRGAQAAALPAAGRRQRRHPGPGRHAAARHHPLAAGPRGGAGAGRRGRVDLPDASRASARRATLARDRRHDPARPAGLDQRAASIRPTTACPTRASSRSRTTGCTSRPTTSRGRPSATRATISGAGFFGGSAISLSDILGNHQLVFAGYVNGRISEAQVLAAYANLSKRINWAVGLSQDPYYFLEPSEIDGRPADRATTSSSPTSGGWWSARSFGQAYYPLSRFQRIEASHAVRQRGRRAAADQRAVRSRPPASPPRTRSSRPTTCRA